MIRRTLFWAHLAAGVVAGIIIGLLCVTGAALAFEKQLVAWAERDARRVRIPADSPVRLSLSELHERVRAARPAAKLQVITVSADPRNAVAFSFGAGDAVYANPYTGEVRAPASTRMARFMQTMIAWHRWLARDGDQRPLGKAITGAGTLAFLFLAVSGLFLWWPRSLSLRSVRAVALFNWRLTGKNRDFNWHNSVGLWCAPILIVLTLTALPISYRWAGTLAYTLTGTPLPAKGPESSGAPPPAAVVPPPPADASPVRWEKLFTVARAEIPAWTTLTLRVVTPDPARPTPVTLVAREANVWPRTATTTLQFDPFTGKLLQRDGYGDLSAARQVRAWTRFLHTGEALGFWGQLVAGLACVGGCVLVYTGLALAWRRFFPRPAPAAQN
jgi:uncharacterized iron-regulated membrane protein